MADKLIDSLKRLGAALVGKVDPSVEAVHQAAAGIKTYVSLRSHYNAVLTEPVPKDLTDTVRRLNGGGCASH